MDWKSFISKTAEVGASTLEGVADVVQSRVASIERRKDRYRDLDDQALATKYRSATGDDRIACRELIAERLRERGEL